MGKSAPTGPGAVHQPGARCKILLDQGCFSNLCGPCDSDYAALLDRLAAAERRAEEAEEACGRNRALAASTLLDLDAERAARESWEREANAANAERIRLHNEAENFSERLGQFEAAGFPNVATVLDRVEAERAAREKAEKRLEESRHTIAISWRDIVNSKELISLPSDVKGDTLADVLAFLLRERIEERAAREAAERELRLANERGSWFRVWAIIETLGISGGGCPDHLVVSHVERLRADLSRAATALRGEDVAVMEAMASAEHDRWSRWYRWQRDNSTPENIARWDRLAATPYSELAEPTKEKDREQVRYALASARAALAGQEVGR